MVASIAVRRAASAVHLRELASISRTPNFQSVYVGMTGNRELHAASAGTRAGVGMPGETRLPACLVAAAPELLDALIKMVAIAGLPHHPATTQAKAIISKARGLPCAIADRGDVCLG